MPAESAKSVARGRLREHDCAVTLPAATSRATPATLPTGARRTGGRVAAGVLAVALVAGVLSGGCAQRTVWAWPPADASVRPGGSVPAPVGAALPHADSNANAAHTPGLDQGVAVFPSWGFADAPGPEASRLDSAMAMRSPDGLPNRLAWSSEPRADLRFQETFRVSRRAESYTFPAVRPGPPRRVIVPVPVPAYPPPRPYPRPWNRLY